MTGSGHAPRSGPEVKNERSSAKNGAPERLLKEEFTAPTFRRLILVVQSPLLFQAIGRNSEAIFPRGLTIQSPPIVFY